MEGFHADCKLNQRPTKRGKLSQYFCIFRENKSVIVETFMNLKSGGTVDFSLMSETLFEWSKKWISETR